MADDPRSPVLRAHHDVFCRGDLAAIGLTYAEDFVALYPGQRGWKGIAGTRQVVVDWRRAFPDFTETVLAMAAQGDLVVSRFRSTGTHLGPLWGYPPTGRRLDMEEMAFFRVANGRLAEQWGMVDWLTVHTQLGLPLPR